MKWIEIKRDKDGFTTEECLNEMFKHEIFVAKIKCDELGLDNYFLCHSPDWRRIIERNKIYTHYLPIPKVEL